MPKNSEAVEETTQPAPEKKKKPALTPEQRAARKAERERRRLYKKTQQDVIAARRERVATLRARGLTLREIQATLGAETILVNGERKPNPNKLLNPETGEAYDLATIFRDVEFLTDQWRKSAAASTDDHRARQFGELQEIKRAAWAARNPHLALMALEKEMKLLGTPMPEKIEHRLEDEQFDILTGREKLRQKLDDLDKRLAPQQDDLSTPTPA